MNQKIVAGAWLRVQLENGAFTVFKLIGYSHSRRPRPTPFSCLLFDYVVMYDLARVNIIKPLAQNSLGFPAIAKALPFPWCLMGAYQPFLLLAQPRHSSRSPPHSTLFHIHYLQSLSFTSHEPQSDCSSAPRLAFDVQQPIMGRYDSMAHGQAQAGACSEG